MSIPCFFLPCCFFLSQTTTNYKLISCCSWCKLQLVTESLVNMVSVTEKNILSIHKSIRGGWAISKCNNFFKELEIFKKICYFLLYLSYILRQNLQILTYTGCLFSVSEKLFFTWGHRARVPREVLSYSSFRSLSDDMKNPASRPKLLCV